MRTSYEYARGTKMKSTTRLREGDVEKERSERVSFFELLDLIDFRDDLRFK